MILITGANGFIGSSLVKEFNSRGRTDIICTDLISLEERSKPLNNTQYKKFMLAKDLWAWLETDEAKKLTLIYHMGACSDTTETDAEFLNNNNTEYTNKLFNYCTKNSIPFLYASSAAVYGDGNKGFSDKLDHETYTPLNLYGLSKQKSDIFSSNQAKTPPAWYGLRFFNVYGHDESHKDHMRSLIHKAFYQIQETKKLKLFRSHRDDYQDGCQKRDFVYVKDITRWLAEMGQNYKEIPSGVYNMGAGTARTWLDLAKSIFDSLKIPMEIDWIGIPENIRNQYQYFTEADMTKLFGAGLSSSQWPLEKGIKDYIENYLVHEKDLGQ